MRKTSVTVIALNRVALVVGLLAVVSASPAIAGGVVGNGSPNTCTEGALDAALAGGGNVTFNCGAKPFTLTVTTTKTIAVDTSLDGGGLLTLSGGGKVHILTVNSGVAVTLSRTTFSRGNNSSGDGGAISNNGTLTLSNCTFSGNTAAGSGGAVANEYNENLNLFSTLTVINCTFSYNSSTYTNGIFGSGDGGAISNESISDGNGIVTTLTVTNSTFYNNSGDGGGGGAIYARYGGATVSDSVFLRNVTGCGGDGGGGAIASWGDLTVTNCTFSRNSLSRGCGWDSGGGAIFMAENQQGTVTNSTFSRNRVSLKSGESVAGGGAIYCDECNLTVTESAFSYNSTANGSAGGAIANGFGGPLTVTTSTFFRNSVSGRAGAAGPPALASGDGGGALFSDGRLIVTDSTLYGNAVNDAGKGGAIASTGTLTITNSTFSRNRVGRSGEGGAIVQLQESTQFAILQNTIVANSARGANCAGFPITDGGHNLQWPSKDTSCVGYFGDPKLGSLKNNGGPTKTLALKAGSAAINAGDNAICAAAPMNNLDQRGFVRPGVSVTNCSIGAYEYNAVAP